MSTAFAARAHLGHWAKDMKKRVCIAFSVIGFIAGFFIAWRLVGDVRNLIVPEGCRLIVMSPMGHIWSALRFSLAAALGCAAIPLVFLNAWNRNHFYIIVALAPVNSVIAFLHLRFGLLRLLRFAARSPGIPVSTDLPIGQLRVEMIPLAALFVLILGSIVSAIVKGKEPDQREPSPESSGPVTH